MAALYIDPNHWQMIYPSPNPESNLVGTLLFNATTMPDFVTGSTFITATNSSDLSNNGKSSQSSQSTPTYALRSRESGPKGFMNTQFVEPVNPPGNTAVNMRNSTAIDGAMLWKIRYWVDGSLYFTNVANGTEWLLSVNDGGGTFMAPNGSSPEKKPTQGWQLRQGDPINDSAYSFVLGMPINAASPKTSTSHPASTSINATSAPAPSTPFAPQSHQGLSPGASAGIGIEVAAVVLIAAASFAFFHPRKRKARGVTEKRPPSYQPKAELDSAQRPVGVDSSWDLP